jgi:hypothetical protein
MFVTHSVEHCPVCDDTTPHSVRRVSVPVVASLALGLGGLTLLLSGRWPAGAPLLLAGLALFLRNREKSWHLRCERCRWKRARAYRRTRPTLDGNTEIFFLS